MNKEQQEKLRFQCHICAHYYLTNSPRDQKICFGCIENRKDEVTIFLQQKKINVLVEALSFYAHDYMFKRLNSIFPNFGESAREALEKCERLDSE